MAPGKPVLQKISVWPAKSALSALTVLAICQLATAVPAAAQYARAYANLPENSSIIGIFVTNSNSDWYTDGDIPTGLKARTFTTSLNCIYSFAGFTENTAAVGFNLPYASIFGYNST
jgi:hypothetical protein